MQYHIRASKCLTLVGKAEHEIDPTKTILLYAVGGKVGSVRINPVELGGVFEEKTYSLPLPDGSHLLEVLSVTNGQVWNLEMLRPDIDGQVWSDEIESQIDKERLTCTETLLELNKDAPLPPVIVTLREIFARLVALGLESSADKIMGIIDEHLAHAPES